MTLHFAYGSNMSRALMNARCRSAEPIGTATLSGWRFVINPEGFGSIAREPGGRVHGVLWRLSARDLAAINAYESVDSGLYLRRRLPVRCGEVQAMALVYIARRPGEGPPRRGRGRPEGGARAPCAGGRRPVRGVADGLAAGNNSEQLFEFTPQHRVDLGRRHCKPEIGETGDAVARLGDPARHDSGVMR